MTFQNDVGTEAFSHIASLRQSVVATVADAARQTIELSGMRRHDDALRQLLHPSTVVGQDVQGVGIDEDGTLRTPDLCDEGDGGVFLDADAGSHSNGIEGLRVDGFGEVAVLVVHLQHGLRHGDLHDGVVALRRTHRYLAGSRPKTSLGGQHGSSRHPIAACNDECVAHLPLVGKLATLAQAAADVGLLLQDKLCIGAGNILLREAYVEHSQLSQEVLVVGQQHRKLLLTKCQREVGFDDICPDVVGVVLGHESRRDVDAHHLTLRLVDVLHQRREATRQRFVQT